MIKTFELENELIKMTLTDYGARIYSIIYKPFGTDIVLSTQRPEQLASDLSYFGATVGRYANRIGNASFDLNGISYMLPDNDNGNCLHGADGFHNHVFDVTRYDNTLVMKCFSPDLDQCFPGNLDFSVSFTLDLDRIIIEYNAVSDRDTVVNFTNHTYFNLNGEGTILDHTVKIDADHFTPVNDVLIPTGQILPVFDTPFDFTIPKTIGRDIHADNSQLRIGKGFDHNFVLNGSDGPAAIVRGDRNGLKMEVYTTEPGIQLYTGNYLKSQNRMTKFGEATDHAALCLETQHFPDSPNKEAFPSTVLKAGERFTSRTVYRLFE